MHDPGYWCFTRAQLDRLLAGRDQTFAVQVLQLLDSGDARRLGLHILPRATQEPRDDARD
jgi:hypothetical protein